MKRTSLALALFAVLAARSLPAQTPDATAEPAPAASPTPESESVTQTRKELDELAAKIEAATEKEAALVEALDQIEQEMASRADELTAIQTDIDKKRAESEAKRARMELLSEKIRDKRLWLRGRLRSIYIHGRPGYLKVLFAAESYADLVRRTKFSRIIARRDTELVAGLKVDLKEVASSRSDYEKDVSLLESALNDSRATNEELEIQRAFRQSLLDEVLDERKSFDEMKKILDARAAELDKTVGGLGTSGTPLAITRHFEASKGRLLTPISKAPVMLGFGPYQHSTGASMRHQGIAYRCAVGAGVKAVFDGRVEMSDWFSTYGRVIVVDHGGGWRTLYAHNSTLQKKKGDTVSEGEVIAECGDTGSFQGPFLFFALYREGTAVDPAEWFLP